MMRGALVRFGDSEGSSPIKSTYYSVCLMEMGVLCVNVPYLVLLEGIRPCMLWLKYNVL